MPGYYEYLISSLPMLHFEARQVISSDNFLTRCLGFIPKKDIEALCSIFSLEPALTENQTLKKWLYFNTSLKNELVKLRAIRKKIDPLKYLRPDTYSDSSIYHTALAAQRNPSPLEGERLLDRQRWQFLDELAIGHYFDLTILIIYALKLLILERWERINTADKKILLEKIMEPVTSAL
ncbi:MAG: DUF2764 family protein [Candidatus Omnitrophota bacterium]|nr:DUF2764 family protein [Candidatus Omnitrophota bacterium]